MLRNRVRASSSDSLDLPSGAGAEANGHAFVRRSSPSSRRSFLAKGRGGGGGGGCSILNLLLTLVLMAASGGGAFYYLKLQHGETETKLQKAVETEKGLVEKLTSEKNAIDSEKKKLQQSVMDAQRTLKSVESQKESDAKRVQDLEATGKHHEEKIRSLVEYKKKMHSAIQKLSLQRLLEKFGPGPHRLEIKLSYDPGSNVYEVNPQADRIVIEMAPEQDMPHTVYTFMEAVDQGLYDGISFHRNAEHVMQAGPVGNFKTSPNTQLYERFKKSGFENVLFQEYSRTFPHHQHTLGYAGRPGGPDFYISTT